MAEHIPIEHVGTAYVDDPREVRRIDRLQKAAERDIARLKGAEPKKQGRKKRTPAGGHNVFFWVNSDDQDRLQALAAAEGVSPNVAAKRIVLRELQVVNP
ncbi:MAG: hypothetical protein ACRDGF_09755 [Chloroflexota bacterium]